MSSFKQIFFALKPTQSKLIEYVKKNKIPTYFFDLNPNSNFCEFIFNDIDSVEEFGAELSKVNEYIFMLQSNDGEVTNLAIFLNGEIVYSFSNNNSSQYNSDIFKTNRKEDEILRRVLLLNYQKVEEALTKPFDTAYFEIASVLKLSYFDMDLDLLNLNNFTDKYTLV